MDGEAPSGPVSIALARHWGLLLFCVGALVVYAAFHPALRASAVVLASVEKAGFIACVCGTSLRQRPMAALMAAGDAVLVLVYGLYLASALRGKWGAGQYAEQLGGAAHICSMHTQTPRAESWYRASEHLMRRAGV